MAWPPGRGGSSGGNFPTQVALDFVWKKADSEQASAILTPFEMYLNCVTAQAPIHHPPGSPATPKETQRGLGPLVGPAHNPTGSACWCRSSREACNCRAGLSQPGGCLQQHGCVCLVFPLLCPSTAAGAHGERTQLLHQGKARRAWKAGLIPGLAGGGSLGLSNSGFS